MDQNQHNENRIVSTADRSMTVYSQKFGETYHSIHGAITESLHVFISNGFDQIEKDTIRIFEMGFGTGLNAILTHRAAIKAAKKIEYTSVELYPLRKELIENVDYSELVPENPNFFIHLHNAPWNETVQLYPDFKLTKLKADMNDLQLDSHAFDLVYYDAFSPETQEDLWTEQVFNKVYSSLDQGGMLLTYCAKGIVKRALRLAGFKVERLAGPPGKHHMIRAVKKLNE